MIQPVFGSAHKWSSDSDAARASALLRDAATALRGARLEESRRSYLEGVAALEAALDCMPLEICDVDEQVAIDERALRIMRRAAQHLDVAAEAIDRRATTYIPAEQVESAGDVLFELYEDHG